MSCLGLEMVVPSYRTTFAYAIGRWPTREPSSSVFPPKNSIMSFGLAIERGLTGELGYVSPSTTSRLGQSTFSARWYCDGECHLVRKRLLSWDLANQSVGLLADHAGASFTV